MNKRRALTYGSVLFLLGFGRKAKRMNPHDKYQGKYRIPSARAPWWNYGWAASYFITICTKNRRHFFGKITNGQMDLSPIGKTAETEWTKTAELRPDMHLDLGAFVVMPNHFHAIITIGNNPHNGTDAVHGVSTIMPSDTKPTNQFAPQSKNLASIVRGFKSAVTTAARKNGNTKFAWQPRFHDHIIRDKPAYHRITQYIHNNPTRWADDIFHRR